jgi:RNA polymerase sigma factor (sigma-70 family)
MLPPGDCDHLKLIISVARHLIETSPICRRRLGRHVEAYLGIGYLGYLRARQAYRPDRNTQFTTYAYVVIQHFMLNEAYSSTLVRVPLYALNEARRTALGLEPTESCRMAEDSVEAARSVFECEYRPLLQEHVERAAVDEGDCEEVDRIDALDYLRRVLKKAMKRLDPPVSKAILLRYYGLRGERLTIREIARELHLGRDYVWRLRLEALKQMRCLVDRDLLGAVTGSETEAAAAAEACS